MWIDAIDVGHRSKPAKDKPIRWTTAAVSSAGIVTQQDFAKTEQEIEINFKFKTEVLKNQLKDYLMNTVKPYGKITITPTVGDELEVGATSPTDFIFVNFEADFIAANLWNIKLLVRRYN